MRKIIEQIFKVKIVDRCKYESALEHFASGYDASNSGWNETCNDVKTAFRLSKEEIEKGVHLLEE